MNQVQPTTPFAVMVDFLSKKLSELDPVNDHLLRVFLRGLIAEGKVLHDNMVLRQRLASQPTKDPST